MYLLGNHHQWVAVLRQEVEQTEELETISFGQQLPLWCHLEVLLAGHHPAQVVELLLVKHPFFDLERQKNSQTLTLFLRPI